ncbi:MAG: hypothetical protein DRP82_04710 [Planctomycetota bacterium]|nr:MAG: hypothetical protein DRP82_04710 [Planctomycetota bacterium]
MRRLFLLLLIAVMGCAGATTVQDQPSPKEQVQPASGKGSADKPAGKIERQGGAPEETTSSPPSEGGSSSETDDFTKWSRLSAEQRFRLAEHYLKSGKVEFMKGDFVRAAHYFRLAYILTSSWLSAASTPQQRKIADEAKRHYFQTLWMIGARKGEPHEYAREFVERTKIRIQQLKWEMERTYVQARRLFDEGRYKEAVEKFERVLELIRWSPYAIDDKGYEDAARLWIKAARIEAKAREIFERQQRLQHVKEAQEAEEVKRLQYIKAKIASGIETARRLIKRQKFDEAIRTLNRVLEMDPEEPEALSLKRYAKEQKRRVQYMNNVLNLNEYWISCVQDAEAAAVPWQIILLYPPKEEWELISQRVPPVMEAVKKEISPIERMIMSRLETTPVNVEFDETPFEDVINSLRDMTGLNIVLSKEARSVTEDKTVTLKVQGVPLKNVLGLILRVDESLRWQVKYGVIYISTESEAEEEELLLEFYSISEITMVPPDYQAPEIALKTGAEEMGGEEEESERGGGFDVDALIELINKVLDEHEQEVGEIEPGAGILVVRKPLSAHRKIQKLLRALRQTVGIMVTVECRFIEIRDNLLDEIGVRWTGLGRTINDIVPGTNVDLGYHYITAHGNTEVRGALLTPFSLPTGIGFPFGIMSTGGLAVQMTYTDVFQIQALLEAVEKRYEALELYAPRLTVFNTQRSYVMAMYQEAYLKDVDINTTGLPVLGPVIGILNHGAILDVRPIVSYDKKYVLLELRPSSARDFTGIMDRPGREVVLQGGLTTVTIELPSLVLTRLRTTVFCPDGGYVLVGGMKNFIEQDWQTGIPIINDIPIVRNLLRRRYLVKVRRREVVLVRCDITILREQERRLFGKASW